jgi:DNA-binding MarR family transcriptional regulator
MDINVTRRRGSSAPPAGDVDRIIQGLRRIVKELHRYSQDVHAAYDLTGPQLWALKTLARSGPLTIGALATALAVHQSSLSVLIDRLEKRGLLARARRPPDRRVVHLALTARGSAVARRAPEPAQGRLLHALRAMPSPKVRQLRRAVDVLVSAMEARDVEARFFFSDD